VLKGKENEHLIQEMEVALRRLRSEYEIQMKEREKLFKENQSLRINKEDHFRKLSDETSKHMY
jgi:hypothetical protein